MMIEQIKIKGILRPSSKTNSLILKLAQDNLAEKMEADEQLWIYLSLLPFIGFFLLIRSLYRGEKITLTPQIYL